MWYIENWKIFSRRSLYMTPIDFSFYGTPKVSKSIAALRLPGFPGIPPAMPGSGSVGCIRTDRDGRTTMSETLRFNIVISVAFTERGTHICVVPALGIPDVEYTIPVPHPCYAPLAFDIFTFPFVRRAHNAFRCCDFFGRNFRRWGADRN